MRSVVLTLSLFSLCILCVEYMAAIAKGSSLDVEQLVHDAFHKVQPHDYESFAIQLIPHIHAASNLTRKGYLCATFIKWSPQNIQQLIENANYSQSFCDWAVVVYNAQNFTLDDMKAELQSKLVQPFEIIIAPPKLYAHALFARATCTIYTKEL